MSHGLRCRRSILITRFLGLLVLAQVALVAPRLGADTPPIAVHERIDLAIQEVHVGPLADVASDAEFLRRCYLDLIGRIPSLTETREFLNDDSPQKRAQLVDRLLESDEFNTFFAVVFDVMLMERRRDNRVTTAQWRSFLAGSLAANKPFDQLAREILAADGSDEKHRPAAKFYLDRDVETHALTRDVSRMFFGRDVQCAQCHDHPLISDYLQEEYYGLFAFLNRSFLFEDAKDNKKAYIGEKAEGQAEFSSVFDPDSDKSLAVPQLTDGLALDGEPRFDGGDAYEVQPKDGKRPVPRYSRRQQLGRLATHATSEAFARNIANRLWAHMMGRGIVEPVDLHHAENPPSHPQLLQQLADEFVAMGCDLRAYIKQLALSKTYQRSIDFPVEPLDTADARAVLNSLAQRQTELELDCSRASQEVSRCSQALARERQNVAEVDAALAQAQKQIDEARQAQSAADKRRQEAEKTLAAKQNQAKSLSTAGTEARKAADALPNDKALADALKTLTARAESLGKESASLQATVDKHKTELEEAATKISQATREMKRLTSERMALVDLVAEARGAYRVVRSQYVRRAALLEDLKQRTAAAQCVVDYSEKLVAESAARTNVDHALKELEPLRQQLAAIHVELAAVAARTAAQEKTVEDAGLEASTFGRGLEIRRKLLETLKQAAETTQGAAVELHDEQLNQAVDTATMRIAELESELATSFDELAARRQVASREQQTLEQFKSRMAQLESQRDGLQQVLVRHQQEFASAQQELSAARAAREATYDALKQSWTRRFAVKPLKPMFPEQLAISTVIALGLEARFRREAAAEWDKKHKDKKPEEIDNDKKAGELRQLYQQRVKQVESTYISLFAAPPASPQDVFSSTVDQALFLANDGRVRGWLQPSDGSLVKRLQGITDPRELGEELYLSVLNRPPTEDENREVSQYMATRTDDRQGAIQDLVWGLLTSLEFRFNH